MPVNPKSKENLKPFKSGADERRNLEGRPPIPRDQKALREYILDYIAEPTKANKVRLDAQIAKMAKTQRGLEVLWAYGFGKVPDKIEGAGENGEILIKFVDETIKKANDQDA